MAEPTLEEIDAFVAGYKTLHGFLQQWDQHFGWNWSARWGLVDSLGVQQAELIFEINAALTRPSITCSYRRYPIYRVDIVPMDECKPNPYGASFVGLPNRVCGPHTHPWAENRHWIKENALGELPFRKPRDIMDIRNGEAVDPSRIRFIRALEVASEDLNIHVTPSQRECEPPLQAALFAERFS